MLTIAKTLEIIKGMHEKQPFNGHPLWSGLIEGRFSKRQVQEFAKQFGIIPLHNHNYHGPLYVVCPDHRWRARIAEVVYEEGTGRLHADGVPHNELYLRFGEDLGLTHDELWKAEYCAECIAIGNYYQTICSRSFLEGCSAHMLAGEAQGPGWYTAMANMFKSRYGVSERGAAFWTVHDKADEDHSAIGAELLGHFAKTEAELELVLKTCRDTLAMSKLFYDGMLRAMQAVA